MKLRRVIPMAFAAVILVILARFTSPTSVQAVMSATPSTPVAHAYLAISTNFEIEPVLKTYLETYPDGDMKNYQIVFQSQYETPETPYSYLIVSDADFEHVGTKFTNYLQAWAKVNRGKWAVTTGTNSFYFPNPRTDRNIIGEYKPATPTK